MTPLASISPSTSPASTHGAVQRSHHAHRRHPAEGHDSAAPEAERSGALRRRNPLVDAMMSALRGLAPAAAATPATPASPDAPAAAVAPAAGTGATTDAAATLRDAAYGFAHALFDALRGGRGESRHEHHGGDGHAQGHHPHHGRHRGGYGDLAQRLTALAATLDGNAAAAQTPPPVTTPPAAATPPAAPAAGRISITIDIDFGGAPAAAPTASPLVDAFKQLLTALGGAAGDNGSPTERLTTFLRQMAQSLSSGAAPASAAPVAGSLLNVSA